METTRKKRTREEVRATFREYLKEKAHGRKTT